MSHSLHAWSYKWSWLRLDALFSSYSTDTYSPNIVILTPTLGERVINFWILWFLEAHGMSELRFLTHVQHLLCNSYSCWNRESRPADRYYVHQNISKNMCLVFIFFTRLISLKEKVRRWLVLKVGLLFSWGEVKCFFTALTEPGF